MDTIISKNKSLSLKFIAAIFIVLTHIFPKVGQVDTLKYIPLFNWNGYPIEQYIGSLSGICVGIFIFLSGYGLYISYNKNIKYKEIFKRISKLYINYWIIILIFFSIGLYMEVYKFEVKEFILNLLALTTSYNHPAWFLRLYVMLILIYPMLIKIVDRYNKNIVIIVSFITNIIGMIITKFYYISGLNSIVIDLISILLGGQFLFLLGIIVAKYAIFDKVKERIGNNKVKYYSLFLIITMLIITVIDISVIGEIAKLILIPIFIFTLANIISEDIFISRLGKHSTNIWLVHAFFYDYLFGDIVYSPKYSILVFLYLLVLCLFTSYMINLIYNLVMKTNIQKMLFNESWILWKI